MGRDGSAHKVSDALIGDETGVVYLTLWDDNIEKVNEADTVRVENGYVTLFKGNIRLNIGKYGKLEPAKEPLAVEVNTENNVSSKTYEQERRPFRGRQRRRTRIRRWRRIRRRKRQTWRRRIRRRWRRLRRRTTIGRRSTRWRQRRRLQTKILSFQCVEFRNIFFFCFFIFLIILISYFLIVI